MITFCKEVKFNAILAAGLWETWIPVNFVADNKRIQIQNSNKNFNFASNIIDLTSAENAKEFLPMNSSQEILCSSQQASQNEL